MPAPKKKAARKRVSTAPQEIIFKTRAGQTITLSDKRSQLDITDGKGNAISITPAGITIAAAGKVTVKAAEIELATASCVVDAAVTKFNGVLECDTLISSSVVSASYTPGAGNLM